MKFKSKFNLPSLFKIVSLVSVLALLSACHSLPVNHGYGHHGYSYSSSTSYDNGHSESRRVIRSVNSGSHGSRTIGSISVSSD